MWSFRTTSLVACFLIGIRMGCGAPESPGEFVARVGDAYLSAEELGLALQDLHSFHDSTGARQQIIDQWITQELLYQEARARNLEQDENVRRQLEASQRAVLIDAYVQELYTEDIAPPSDSDLQSYYDLNRDRLRLREPFVQIRYLSTANPDTAREARQHLQAATTAGTIDSLWLPLVQRFASDPEGSQALSMTYYPERHLLTDLLAVNRLLPRLQANQISAIIETDSMFHIVQLVARAPAGAIPERSWIEDEIHRQLLLDERKQLYVRHVQRLRNEALSENSLEIK